MMQRNLFIGITLLAATAVAAYGEIYTWTDNQGTVHFSEDAASVPAKYRKKMRNIDESAAPTAETAQEPQTTGGEAKPPAVNAGAATAEELHGYTTRDEWQAELQKQEADMAAVRQRLDELATEVKNTPRRTVERDKLETEYRTLQPQYNAMKARYSRLVEAARKAGFPVDLHQ